MLRILIILVLTITMASCASAGRKFDRTHINDIKIGVQDKDQIRAWFGHPYQVVAPLSEHPKGCADRWIYTFARAVGFGKVTQSDALVVDFDKEGKVCDHGASISGGN